MRTLNLGAKAGARAATLATCVGVLALAGCGEPAAKQAGQTEAPPASVAIPATLFVTAAPAASVPLLEAKGDAKAGDRIVFEARVGGSREPFVENRAVFSVADASIQSCDQLHADGCDTPWDYCCEPRDNLTRHMATVRVVDESGQPLKVSLLNAHGLAPLRTVVVSGTVSQIDEAGNFVVDAETIHVKEG